MSNSIAQLINERRKRKGFLGKAWDLAKAGALGYLGYKAFKNRAAIGDTLTGLKKTVVNPLRHAGLSSKIADAQAMKDAAEAGSQAQSSALTSILNDPNIPADEKAKIVAGMAGPTSTIANVGTKADDDLKSAEERKKRIKEQNQFMNNESTDIKNFINELGQKNYSGADKYLKKVVEDKLQTKIAKQIKTQKLY